MDRQSATLSPIADVYGHTTLTTAQGNYLDSSFN